MRALETNLRSIFLKSTLRCISDNRGLTSRESSQPNRFGTFASGQVARIGPRVHAACRGHIIYCGNPTLHGHQLSTKANNRPTAHPAPERRWRRQCRDVAHLHRQNDLIIKGGNVRELRITDTMKNIPSDRRGGTKMNWMCGDGRN